MELCSDRLPIVRFLGGEITTSAGTAKQTAPDTAGPVAVGTGHAGIEGNLVDFLTICFFQFIVECVVGFVIPAHHDVDFTI